MVKTFQSTDAEQKILPRQGFVVSERLHYGTFMAALADVYHKDLPVFISADALLQAVHASCDMTLKKIELDILRPALQTLLEKLRATSSAALEWQRCKGKSRAQGGVYSCQLTHGRQVAKGKMESNFPWTDLQ